MFSTRLTINRISISDDIALINSTSLLIKALNNYMDYDVNIYYIE